MQITFTAYVKPQPQGSLKYAGHRKGKPVLQSDNKALKGFRELVGYAARKAVDEARLELPMAGKGVAVELVLDFSFVLPKSVKFRPFHTVKPDIDKLQRAILDAGTGILWHDDNQVVQVFVRKGYGPVEQVHLSATVCKSPQRK